MRLLAMLLQYLLTVHASACFCFCCLDVSRASQPAPASAERVCPVRSLKSANILLNSNSRAQIADVGLAKTLTNVHNNRLSTYMATCDLGTFAWSAPEVGPSHCQIPHG